MAWDDNRRHTEIIATRIYFLLVTLAIIILIIYTSAEIQTQHIVVYNPSEKTFEQL
jgi:hypothetical protein